MSFQVLDNLNPSVSGRIGKGFAKGLKKTVPDEVKRLRMSSGIEALRKGAERGDDALSLLSKAYTTPGLTPEMAQQLQPYLRQAGLQSQRQSAPQNAQLPAQRGLNEQGEPQSRNNTAQRKTTVYRKGNVEDIANRGLQLSQENPLLYPTQEAGAAAAQKEYDTQQADIQAIDDAFDQVLATRLQKGGEQTYKDVVGDAQFDLRKRAADDVVSGKLSRREAIDKYTKYALRLGDAKKELEAVKSLSSSPTENLKQLKRVGDVYADVGRRKDFRDQIISQFKMTDQNASVIAYPPSTDLSKQLHTTPAHVKGRKGDTTSQIVTKTASALTDQDSVFTLLKGLENRGYDPYEVMNELNTQYKNGIIKLTQDQADELKRPAVSRPSLGDFFLYKMVDKDVLGEDLWLP